MPSETGPLQRVSRVGVLGGTFDPPHYGHLSIARHALDELSLDEVLFAPTRNPPHKQGLSITPIDDRLEMVRLAIEGEPRFRISRVDIDRTGPTYTVDTIRLLNQELGPTTSLYFIMGMDSLASLPTWHKPEELVRLCALAVFPRPGFQADIAELEKKLPGLRSSLVLLAMEPIDISATELQRRIYLGELIDHLVPPAVAEYIRLHGLYRSSPDSSGVV